MKKFLFKISFYMLGILLLFGILGFYADGNTDNNYMHFAVEKPQNIILGDSRGAQGIVPAELEKKLAKKFDNFSLNIVQSPYGQIYLDALKRKIDPDTKNGIFILTVNPWNLSLDVNVKRLKDYPEEQSHSPFTDMHFYDCSPNYEYLLKHYGRSWFKLYTEREEAGKSNTYLHKDGWMEVTVDMQKDSVSKRVSEKINFYKDMSVKQKLSDVRLSALSKIIEYLKDKGTVYLVRIPATEKILEIENKKFPEFNKLIQNMAAKHHVAYYDLTTQYADYLYSDGTHMYKESGKVLSGRLADSIALHRKH
ncbi:hypothetical protein [Chryseobacterium populi]|nr:hypothetical protein [Chryseobacterium populi]